MECANARYASRCGDGRSMRPHLCATFVKCRTTVRSNARCAASTRRNSTRARTPPAHHVAARA
eukprot:7235606-Lingulodinium_polyedra.AAC.1